MVLATYLMKQRSLTKSIYIGTHQQIYITLYYLIKIHIYSYDAVKNIYETSVIIIQRNKKLP